MKRFTVILFCIICLIISSATLYAQKQSAKLKYNPKPIEFKENRQITFEHKTTPKVRKDIDLSRKKPDHIDEPIRPSLAIDTAATTSSNKSVVLLQRADSIKYNEVILPDIQVVMGNVLMQHDDAFLYCDSAYINEQTNSFLAFGAVRIEQGDSVTIYSRYLDYDGNSKIARLKHKVKMINGEVMLTTDSLTYNRNTAVGYYTCGGTLQDSVNTLVSKTGYYNTNSKVAEFKEDVHGENSTSTIDSDTLIYNTNTKIAKIVGPTTIVHEKETTIYSEFGWYNTNTDCSELLKNTLITHSDGKTLEGDTIFNDNKNGYSKAFHNVLMTDTANCMLLSGHYGFYQQEGDVAVITDRALIRRYDVEHDTTYIHSDTLYTYAVDSIQHQTIRHENDSVQAQPQEPKTEGNMIHAFHNVRMYNKDYQAVCDSLTFFTSDTITHMMGLPILWNEDKQLTGDTIHTYPKNGSVDRMEIIDNAIIIIETGKNDTVHYNQMAGKKIVGYIVDQNLDRIEISGNAEAIFFPKEEDGYLIGLNKIESSYMSIYFIDSKLDKLVTYPSPKASMYPPVDIKENLLHLTNFSWQDNVRPHSPEDVFRHPKRLSKSDIEKRKKELKAQEQEERKEQRRNRKKQTDTTEPTSQNE